MKIFLLATLTAALAAAPLSASARIKRVTSRADDLPITLLARLCERGLVALVEGDLDGSSRQVILFARVPAPPERIYDVLMDVESYPKFLNTLDDVYVTGRRGSMFSFSWTLDLPLFALKGTRLQRGLRPRRVESRGRTGNLRGTRERWELYPVQGGTLVAFYRALDVETGGFLLRTLIDMEPSMEAGANLSSGFIHLRGLERYILGQPVAKSMAAARKGPVPPFDALDLDKAVPLGELAPLLEHGQLAVIESHDDGTLKQVALLAATDVPAARVRTVVADPQKYTEFLPNLSHQKVTARPGGDLQLDWTIRTPVSSMSGTALMQLSPQKIEVNAIRGDVERARIEWRFVPVSDKRSVAVYYTYSDIRAASWVTRKLLEAEPLLEHGMVAAAGTVALTAMTARAEGRR